jgi:hypothetical protein
MYGISGMKVLEAIGRVRRLGNIYSRNGNALVFGTSNIGSIPVYN